MKTFNRGPKRAVSREIGKGSEKQTNELRVGAAKESGFGKHISN
jgi:hypothetical protein